MKYLLKRLIRSVRSNIKSYLAIVLISLLSVMLYTGLSANYHYLDENVKNNISQSNVADNFITLTRSTSEDKKVLNDSYYEINELEQRLYAEAYIKERKIILISQSSENKMGLPSKIVDGSSGVMITKSFAKRRKIKVGDEVSLSLRMAISDILVLSEDVVNIFTNALIEGKENIIVNSDEVTLKFKVTGIMQHAEAMGNLASDIGIIYMNDDTLKDAITNLVYEHYNLSSYYKFLFTAKLSTQNISNQYMLKGGNLTKILEYFNAKENNNLLMISKQSLMPGIYAALLDAKAAKGLCFVFPIVFYITALLVIVVSIDKMISKDHEAIGILMAMGIKRSRISLYYVLSSSINILIGSILGLILGPVFVPRIINIKYNKLYDLPSYNHSLIYPSFILAFLVLILVTIIMCFIKCHKYFKSEPRDVITSNIVSKKKKPLIDRIIPKKAYSLHMAIRNIFWNKTKSILVIVGIMGCASLLVCGYGIEDTLNYGINLEIKEKLDYDIEVSYDHTRKNSSDIKKLDSRIEYVEEYSYSLISVDANSNLVDTILNIISPSSNGFNIPISNDGVTISKKIASMLKVDVGDSIGIYKSGKYYKVEVAYITSMFFSQGVYMSNEASPMAYQNNRCIVNVSDGTRPDDVAKVILGNGKSQETGIYYAKTKNARMKSAENTISSLRIITGMIKVFAVLLAILVLYNLVSLNFGERIRDISILKSLGYGYGENLKSLILEISILETIGGIIGLAVGYPFLKAVLGLNEPPMISFIYKINLLSYIISFVLTIILGILLNLLISIKIKDIDLVETLKNKE